MSRTNGPRRDDPFTPSRGHGPRGNAHSTAEGPADGTQAAGTNGFDPLDPFAYPGSGRQGFGRRDDGHGWQQPADGSDYGQNDFGQTGHGQAGHHAHSGHGTDDYGQPVFSQQSGYQQNGYAGAGQQGYQDPNGVGGQYADPYATSYAGQPHGGQPHADQYGGQVDPNTTWGSASWPDQTGADHHHDQRSGAANAQSSYAPQFAPYDPAAAAQSAQQGAFDPNDIAGSHDNPAHRLRGSDYDNWYPGEPQGRQGPAAGGGYSETGYRASPDFGVASPGAGAQHAGGPYADFNVAPSSFGSAGFDPAAAGTNGFDATLSAADGRSGLEPGFGLDPGMRGAPVGRDGTELDPGYDDDEDYEPQPARSTTRRMAMIAGALVGAIAVGGGLAYGYKMVMGGGSGDAQVAGNPPMVRSPSSPNRVRPDDPGGRKFAHTDSKVMDRLGGGTAATASVTASNQVAARPATRDANGARRVSTISIGPDGALRQPRPALTPTTPTPSNPAVQIPGLSVVGAGPIAVSTPSTASVMPPRRETAQQVQPQRTNPIVIRPPATGGPARVATLTPTTRPRPFDSSPTPTAGAAEADAQTTGAVMVRTAPDGRNARMMNPVTGRFIPVLEPDRKGAVPPDWQGRSAVSDVVPTRQTGAQSASLASGARRAPSTTSAVPGSGSPGYVAVLASIPVSPSSRVEALARFADIQQNYGNVLVGKSPDVQEANLGARGRYHRLMVGPPGSQDYAAAVCRQLQKAGYSGCWVSAY